MTVVFLPVVAGSLDPHVTILELPRGAVHVGDRLLDGQASGLGLVHEVWCTPAGEAARLNQSVRVSLGRVDGGVVSCVVAPDGRVSAVDRHPRRQPVEPVDPRWADGMPDRRELLGVVRAADRAGQEQGAQVAAARLVAQLVSEVGDWHPHTVVARELQAHFALKTKEWTLAAGLYGSAAAGRYVLGAPEGDTQRALRNAVSCWARGRREQGAFEIGVGLAHLLVRTAPEQRGPLAAVLGGLEGEGW